eukprot:3627465-Amphidinium_carterae.1
MPQICSQLCHVKGRTNVWIRRVAIDCLDSDIGHAKLQREGILRAGGFLDHSVEVHYDSPAIRANCAPMVSEGVACTLSP